MALAGSDPQYREKAAVWALLGNLPLYVSLNPGTVWRWFAASLPMDLGTGGFNRTDIDLLACYVDLPRSENRFYCAWEVKVGVLRADGSGQSLKSGKIDRTMKQLEACRDFGVPLLSLLDVYLCEYGFMASGMFPPPVLIPSLRQKLQELHRRGFGYKALPFHLASRSGSHHGDELSVFNDSLVPLRCAFDVLPPTARRPGDGFVRLVERIEKLLDETPHSSVGFQQIVFCRSCRRLQVLRMRDEVLCPNCRDNLVRQS